MYRPCRSIYAEIARALVPNPRPGAAQEAATSLVSTVESLHSLWGPRKSALLEGTLIPGRRFSVWSELERTGTRSFGVSGFDAVSWSVRYAFPPDSEGLEHRNSARGLTGKALAGSPLSPYIYCDMVRISVLPLAPLISQHALRNRGRSLGGSAGGVYPASRLRKARVSPSFVV